jgi:hypothetical protein
MDAMWTAPSSCAQCGGSDFAQPVTATVRGVAFTYCSSPCRDEHAIALTVAPTACDVPGCDADAVADLPFCALHLDGSAHLDGSTTAA